jgi:hypothetical protein
VSFFGWRAPTREDSLGDKGIQLAKAELDIAKKQGWRGLTMMAERGMPVTPSPPNTHHEPMDLEPHRR